jgi:uncharacterized repeat protein (TIGR02543 family)
MTLTVVSSPRCAGEITSDPAYSNWKFYPTDNVTLRAVAQPGYAFVNWTGDVDGATDTSQDSIIVQMGKYYPDERDLNITANFTAPGGLYAVTVEGKPMDGGTVSIQTPCGSFATDNVQPAMSIEFAAGTEVTLTAAPAEGYRFGGWAGDLSGSQDNMTVVVDSSKTITAKFGKPSPFPWPWVVIGAAAFFAAVLAVAKLFYGRYKKPMGTPST